MEKLSLEEALTQMKAVDGGVQAPAGVTITWGISHMRQGSLISRQVIVLPPESPKCASVKCLGKFVLGSITYSLIVTYHRARVTLAEKKPKSKLPLHYRTGEQSPITAHGALLGIIKIKFRGLFA